ncbi:MAG: hypothetical protein ACD_5C00016G0008 [uncultured bacterium]|nr:MAG: hypothetical protein ACD_5C00016G0008 [uncultured bacterium]
MTTKLRKEQIQNPYKARAYRNTTNQSIATSTDTKVQFNAESYDTNSNFDSSTNYRYTVPVTGYYQINCIISFATNGTGLRRVDIKKNGTSPSIMAAVDNANAASFKSVSVGGCVFLTAGDYIETIARQESGGNLDIIAAEYISFLDIHLLSI